MQGNSDAIDLDVSVARDGYGWRFPKGETTLIGFASSYVADMECMELAKEMFPAGVKVKGAFLPYGGGIRTVADTRGMLLVGDAAGFVDAITGEGTYYAIKSGEIAALSIEGDIPVKEYIDKTQKIRKEVNESWKLISKFYRFRKLILNVAKKHEKFIGFICDNQVSTQKCDFSVVKMMFMYKRRK